MTGLVVLLLAVLAAVGFGLYRRHVDGRFISSREMGEMVPRVGRNGSPSWEKGTSVAWSRIAAAVSDVEPGDRATLVQFSSAFCAPCRTTRVVLADIAEREPGVRHVEIDAEQHLDLVRALDVRRTPTTLVLDGAGNELVRAAGAPRRDQVLAVLAEVAR